jgi:hypothetical protein
MYACMENISAHVFMYTNSHNTRAQKKGQLCFFCITNEPDYFLLRPFIMQGDGYSSRLLRCWRMLLGLNVFCRHEFRHNNERIPSCSMHIHHCISSSLALISNCCSRSLCARALSVNIRICFCLFSSSGLTSCKNKKYKLYKNRKALDTMMKFCAPVIQRELSMETLRHLLEACAM